MPSRPGALEGAGPGGELPPWPATPGRNFPETGAESCRPQAGQPATCFDKPLIQNAFCLVLSVSGTPPAQGGGEAGGPAFVQRSRSDPPMTHRPYHDRPGLPAPRGPIGRGRRRSGRRAGRIGETPRACGPAAVIRLRDDDRRRDRAGIGEPPQGAPRPIGAHEHYRAKDPGDEHVLFDPDQQPGHVSALFNPEPDPRQPRSGPAANQHGPSGVVGEGRRLDLLRVAGHEERRWPGSRRSGRPCRSDRAPSMFALNATERVADLLEDLPEDQGGPGPVRRMSTAPARCSATSRRSAIRSDTIVSSAQFLTASIWWATRKSAAAGKSPPP